MRKKLAILGASYLQKPLVEKASEMGIETYVFSWEEESVVREIADRYYPVSILDRERILQECKAIGVHGITSIASDLAMPTVNYVASMLGLVGNSMGAALRSTDKYEMRKTFKAAGLSCPVFELYTEPKVREKKAFSLPLIVKPVDRSGSRGVTKIESFDRLEDALELALQNSIKGMAIVEEYMDGREFSVEMISYKNEHHFIAITEKVTSGPPHFVETEHHQPAQLPAEVENRIVKLVRRGLNCLGIQNGASHSEVIWMDSGEIRIVEIAGRMGGDFIGSHLVPESTGFDFLKAVIDSSLGQFDYKNFVVSKKSYSGVYFVLPRPGRIVNIENNSSQFPYIKKAIPILKKGEAVPVELTGSNSRAGIILYVHPEKKWVVDPNKVLSFQTI